MPAECDRCLSSLCDQDDWCETERGEVVCIGCVCIALAEALVDFGEFIAEQMEIRRAA